MIDRSHLYSLEPRGIGSPYVESIISYIERLADQHRVPVYVLVNHELIPEMSKKLVTCSDLKESIWHKNLRTLLNGSLYGEAAVKVLEKLTSRNDLTYMSLFSLTKIIGATGLVRLTKAWCPECLSESQLAGHIYEQLLWTLQEVMVCPKHHRYLQEFCPHCGHRNPHSAWHRKNGYCGICNGYLGQSKEKTKIGNEFEIQSANVIGKLISDMPGVIHGFSQKNITNSIRKIIDERYNGRRCDFGREIGINRQYISKWYHGNKIPSFQNIIWICCRLNLDAEDIFSANIDAKRIIVHNELSPLKLPRIYRREKITAVDKNVIRNKIQLCLTSEDAPVSISQIAKEFDVNPKALQKLFPNECKMIRLKRAIYFADKKRDEYIQLYHDIRNTMLQLREDGIYPTSPKVLNSIKINTFRGNKIAYYFWRKILVELGY